MTIGEIATLGAGSVIINSIALQCELWRGATLDIPGTLLRCELCGWGISDGALVLYTDNE